MDQVIKIIELHGGIERLQEMNATDSRGLVIEHSAADLHIRGLGEGPNKHPLIAIAHYYWQEGDRMCDPEILVEWTNYPVMNRKTLEFKDKIRLFPVEITQNHPGAGQARREVYAFKDGEVYGKRMQVQRSIESFMSSWNKDLKGLRYVQAAKEQKKEVEAGAGK